jgi:hypothetical protein
VQYYADREDACWLAGSRYTLALTPTTVLNKNQWDRCIACRRLHFFFCSVLKRVCVEVSVRTACL